MLQCLRRRRNQQIRRGRKPEVGELSVHRRVVGCQGQKESEDSEVTTRSGNMDANADVQMSSFSGKGGMKV